VVVKPRLLVLALLAGFSPTKTLAGDDSSIKIDCVPITNSTTALPTEKMIELLGKFATDWNPEANYSVAASGSMGRIFSGAGRAIHPKEMAAIISKSPDFKGQKAKGVWLGVSDGGLDNGDSYAARLAKILGVSVVGCDGDFYLLKSGMVICGSGPKHDGKFPSGIGRSMPSGFTMNSAFTNFCEGKGTTVDPQTMVSATAAFGLYEDEIEKLKLAADGDSRTSFRLYQYYWLSTRDPKSAIIWLEKAAAQGLPVAKFNLAYELFEAGGPENFSKARGLASELVAEGFAGPDLRKIYGEN
jgi:hypothetical protein